MTSEKKNHKPEPRKKDSVHTSTYIPREVKERLVKYCEENGKKQQDFIAEAITAALSESLQEIR